jgi:hypothetical protein
MNITVIKMGKPGICYLCGNKAKYGEWDAWPNKGYTYVVAYNCVNCEISWREYYRYLGYREDD